MKVLAPLVGIGACLLLTSCAKFPDTPDAGEGPRLIFRLKVDGKIRFGTENNVQSSPYIYMVALNPSELDNPTTQGPIPVIAPPWGNGFVAGNATHFIWWDPTQASPFTLYKFTNADLTQWSAVGVPINAVNASPAARAAFRAGVRERALRKRTAPSKPQKMKGPATALSPR